MGAGRRDAINDLLSRATALHQTFCRGLRTIKACPKLGPTQARQAHDAPKRLHPAVPPDMIGCGTWEGAHG